MKKLSIEQKAKRYDEAIKAAIVAYKDDDRHLKATLERIFPELKESEDEMIRKALIDWFSDKHAADNFKGIAWERIVAWLEKQGEQNLTLPKWKYKNDNAPLLRDSLILNKYGCVAKSPSGAIVSGVWVIDYDELAKLPKEEIEKQSKQETLCDKCRKEQPSHSCQDITALGRCALEKQGEQKPADNIKPKFKIGDWAVSNLDKKARQISEVYFDEYNNYYVVESNEYDIEEYDRLHHLWTIQDAKNGDVLIPVDNKHPFIYKGCLDPDHPNSPVGYCGIDFFGEFLIGGKKLDNWWTDKEVKPATKEQCELLFQKMHKAGYAWDAEKKELKKIL